MSVPKPVATDLVFQVLNEIGIIDSLAQTELSRHIAPDLNPSEFGVLNHFVRLGDGKTPSWLAAAFQMTRPSMTAIVTKLSALGFVHVEPGEKDRREKFVYLTDAGREVRADALARPLEGECQHPIAEGGGVIVWTAGHILRKLAKNER
ncbi:MAG: MarR family transcriptional regulator [Pseudomonadota bacterium]